MTISTLQQLQEGPDLHGWDTAAPLISTHKQALDQNKQLHQQPLHPPGSMRKTFPHTT